MTHEEAKNIILVLKSRITNPQNVEAFSLAIDSLEKQIPKKIKSKTMCPVCNERLVDYLDRVFCSYCGQRIEW